MEDTPLGSIETTSVIFKPLEDIIVKQDRQRRQFKEERLEDLITDILSPHGLLHPLVLEADGTTLISGERRFRAITRIYEREQTFTYAGRPVPPGYVPVVIHSKELSEYERELAQFSENAAREGLTWQEEQLAIAKLFELREKELGKKPLRKDVAAAASDLLGRRVEYSEVAPALLLAKNMDRPEVVRAPNKKAALARLTEAIRRETEGLVLQHETPTATTLNIIIEGDAFEELPKMKADTFDGILTDPPYGIGAHNFGNYTEGIKYYTHHYKDEGLLAYQLIFREGYRLCKDKAFLFAFCDIRHYHALQEMGSHEGWWVSPTPLIWDKEVRTIFEATIPDPRRGLARSYETILYGLKGGMVALESFLDIVRVPRSKSAHPAGKPPALYLELLRLFGGYGLHVLDPFAGSGPIFPAVNALRAKATGIEVDAGWAGECRKRLHSKEVNENVEEDI